MARVLDVSATKRHTKVTIEHDLGSTPPGKHEHEPKWHRYCERFANVRQLSAREIQYAEQTLGLASHVVTLRGDRETVAITSLMRVVANGRTLHIFGVEDVEFRGREVKLYCGEKAQV